MPAVDVVAAGAAAWGEEFALMTERPILFSAPMVRAMLAGAKTQTRRVLKPQPVLQAGWVGGGYWERRPASLSQPIAERWCLRDMLQFCPYGAPGDRLWVREAWARDDEDGAMMYRADLGRDACADAWEQGRIEGVPRYRWRPSIHMPRWASRITLEITGVRVERLQDISEGDCVAEGIQPIPQTGPEPGPLRFSMKADGGWVNFATAAEAYAHLWESINGPGSWNANPWVWVVGFKRVEPA